jgi:hypothetical protein
VDEELKTVGAFIGLLTVIATFLLTFKGGTPKPHEVTGDTATHPIRVLCPPPWKRLKWPVGWKQEDYRKRWWRVRRIAWLAALIYLMLLVGALLIISINDRDPIGFALAVLNSVSLVTITFALYRTMRQPWKSWSPAQQRGEILLTCSSIEELLRQSVRALAAIGATIVCLDESKRHIEAAAGIFRFGVTGSQIIVKVRMSNSMATIIVISDDIGPDLFYSKRSNVKYVTRFIEQFIG